MNDIRIRVLAVRVELGVRRVYHCGLLGLCNRPFDRATVQRVLACSPTTARNWTRAAVDAGILSVWFDGEHGTTGKYWYTFDEGYIDARIGELERERQEHIDYLRAIESGEIPF